MPLATWCVFLTQIAKLSTETLSIGVWRCYPLVSMGLFLHLCIVFDGFSSVRHRRCLHLLPFLSQRCSFRVSRRIWLSGHNMGSVVRASICEERWENLPRSDQLARGHARSLPATRCALTFGCTYTFVFILLSARAGAVRLYVGHKQTTILYAIKRFTWAVYLVCSSNPVLLVHSSDLRIILLKLVLKLSCTMLTYRDMNAYIDIRDWPNMLRCR